MRRYTPPTSVPTMTRTAAIPKIFLTLAMVMLPGPRGALPRDLPAHYQLGGGAKWIYSIYSDASIVVFHSMVVLYDV
jgi:hypothetical protein